MGNGASVHEKPTQGGSWWVRYCREEWRSLRVRQLDELLGLQRPALRRGQSSANLDELVRKLTSDPLPFFNEVEDNSDLKAAIAKLQSGSILHTEKRAIERLLAQRYEDALAIATASSEAQSGSGEDLAGASEVLRKVLAVLRHNGLETELDRSGAEEPAEWRPRAHAARRRAFLVVRSMVRLKREVKRLSAPINDLGWLLPVAAHERWGELKGLAAKYRELEGVLHDTEVAIVQLTQMKEAQAKTSGAKHSGAGRGSPQRTLRTGAGRVPGTAGRAVSESGAVNSRGRPRTMLTADPPPPPVAGMRGGRRNAASVDSAAGGGGPSSMPLLLGSPGAVRASLAGKRPGGAGGPEGAQNGNNGLSNGGSVPGSSSGSSSALVPTISAQRAAAAAGNGVTLPPPLTGLYGTRLSVSGGSAGGAASSPHSGTGGPPATILNGVGPGGQNRGSMTGGTTARSSFTNGPSEGGMLPFVSRVAHMLDLTVPLPQGFGLHPPIPSEPPGGPLSHLHASPSEGTVSFNSPTSASSVGLNGAGPRKQHPLLEAVANGVAQRAAGGRMWPGGVEPSPPAGPPPTSGARRPLGPLSLSSPSPLPGSRTLGDGSPGGAGGDGSQQLQVLIQDGETVDQALARFKLLADDARCALVDTSRQFRGVLDLCNSAWPDQRWWLPAHTHDEAAMDTWTTTDEYVVNRADIVRCLKAGVVAFQFICYSEQPLVGPTGNRFDLWTSDPWEVAADLAPEKVAEVQAHQHQQQQAARPGEHPGRLVGMPLGVRVLQQLANSVAEVAGPLAVEGLPIILHIGERQQESIAADLLQYGIYRRLRRNLYLVVQRSHPTMRYSPQQHAYEPAEDQPKYNPGAGFSMLQLLWPGHVLHMNEAGELERLPHSLMQELRNRSTEWFVSRTCQDLSLLTEDGALDMRSLTHVSYMWNAPDMRYSVAVEATSTYAKHRELVLQHGSVLLCRKPKVTGMVVGRLDGAVRVDRYGGGSKPQLPVVELLACELNSPHMQHELTQIANTRAAMTSVGIGRYVFRFEVLSSLLTGPTVLRPKLLPACDIKAGGVGSLRRPSSLAAERSGGAAAILAGAGPSMFPFPTTAGFSEAQLAYAASQGLDTVLLRLHLSISDLTMHHASKVVALKAHRLPIYVRGAEDGPQLVELLAASDLDLSEASARLAAKLPSFTRQQKQGQNILVFVQDNSVSLTATNVAAGLVRRERGDRVHLFTVVPTEAQRGEGAALLDRLMKAFRTAADVVPHVMSQEGRGLLECVGDVVSQHRCGLLIVGSSSITAVANIPPPRNTPLLLPTPGLKLPGTAMAGPQGPGGGGAGRGGGVGAGGVPAIGSLMDDAASSELLLSSVALSILRTFALPVILVTANTKNYLKRAAETVTNGNRRARPAVGGVGGATVGRLAAMAVVERHSRPMMHHLARCLLEPSLRQDALTLTQVLPAGTAPGNQGYDPTSIQTVALKTLMANFESIAAANDFHTPHKVMVQGDWHNALCAAARDNGAQLLALQLAPGTTKSLPPMLLQLVRSAPCPVLIYPERVIVPGSELLAEDDDDSS